MPCYMPVNGEEVEVATPARARVLLSDALLQHCLQDVAGAVADAAPAVEAASDMVMEPPGSNRPAEAAAHDSEQEEGELPDQGLTTEQLPLSPRAQQRQQPRQQYNLDGVLLALPSPGGGLPSLQLMTPAEAALATGVPLHAVRLRSRLRSDTALLLPSGMEAGLGGDVRRGADRLLDAATQRAAQALGSALRPSLAVQVTVEAAEVRVRSLVMRVAVTALQEQGQDGTGGQTSAETGSRMNVLLDCGWDLSDNGWAGPALEEMRRRVCFPEDQGAIRTRHP